MTTMNNRNKDELHSPASFLREASEKRHGVPDIGRKGRCTWRLGSFREWQWVDGYVIELEMPDLPRTNC
jgi:hypothetical protein